MTRASQGRPLDGILLLDKPSGCTSNAVLQQVKRLFNAAKAGHTGSLDPLASGMLPICFGEATKVSGFLLDADKTYRVGARLGRQTSTGDADGETVRTLPVPGIGSEALRELLAAFVGESQQVPPMYSALKHQGQRLYNLARKGQIIDRPARSIRIHEIRLIGVTADFLEMEVRCSKGTYIRSLVEDIGARLGSCAHVEQLRRLAVGPFTGQMQTIQQLEENARSGLEAIDKTLLSTDAALTHWAEVLLDEEAAYSLRQGQAVSSPPDTPPGRVRVYDRNRVFLGIGEVLPGGRIMPRRLLARQGRATR
jgi:tRNA pseudouridine55 synthase